MAIEVIIMSAAEKDLKKMDRIAAQRIAEKLQTIEREGKIVGDVKRLT